MVTTHFVVDRSDLYTVAQAVHMASFPTSRGGRVRGSIIYDLLAPSRGKVDIAVGGCLVPAFLSVAAVDRVTLAGLRPCLEFLPINDHTACL